MLGHTVHCCDVRQVDFGFRRRGELDFCLLSGFFEALQGHGVFAQVHALLRLEAVGQPVNDDVVKVVAPEVRIAVGGLHFGHATTHF